MLTYFLPYQLTKSSWYRNPPLSLSKRVNKDIKHLLQDKRRDRRSPKYPRRSSKKRSESRSRHRIRNRGRSHRRRGRSRKSRDGENFRPEDPPLDLTDKVINRHTSRDTSSRSNGSNLKKQQKKCRHCNSQARRPPQAGTLRRIMTAEESPRYLFNDE